MTTSNQVSSEQQKNVAVGHRYFTVMALVMIAISIAGFLPAIVDPSSRRAPLTPLAAIHGLVYFAWLLLFFVQTRLVATGRVAVHRRLGLTGIFLLAVMIPLGYVTTIEMVRRGFDLSGDQHLDPHPRAGYIDAQYGAVFNLVGLTIFAALATAALAYRRRSEIHKRLMLYANIGLMPSPVAHFFGHVGVTTPVALLGTMGLLLLSGLARDYLVTKRIHPLTGALAICFFASMMLDGGVIGPSAAWHRIVDWLAR